MLISSFRIFHFAYPNTRETNFPQYAFESPKNGSNAFWGLTLWQLVAIEAFRMLIYSFRIFHFASPHTRETNFPQYAFESPKNGSNAFWGLTIWQLVAIEA